MSFSGEKKILKSKTYHNSMQTCPFSLISLVHCARLGTCSTKKRENFCFFFFKETNWILFDVPSFAGLARNRGLVEVADDIVRLNIDPLEIRMLSLDAFFAKPGRSGLDSDQWKTFTSSLAKMGLPESNECQSYRTDDLKEMQRNIDIVNTVTI